MSTAGRIIISIILGVLWISTGFGIITVILAAISAFLAPKRGRGADIGLHMGMWWGIFYLVFLAMQRPTEWTDVGASPADNHSGGNRRLDLPPPPPGRRYEQ